ncbi:MAG TPA: porin family protein, partial [Candidatus Eisenbacteria bacterium]|nr:porin family protein [Candidatus Eisenbacteria bacterium]
MKNTIYVTAFCLLAGSVAAVSVSAEQRWSAEFSGGAAFSTEELGEADLGTGLGFEGTVSYRFLPHLAVYGGWDWFHFSTDGSPWGGEMDVEETGYVFGLRFVHPVGDWPLSYMLRAGGTFDHIEIENDEGEIVADSDHGLGWEIGAGLVYALNDRWGIVPGIR